MSGGLSGFSMFELFRQEVATHVRAVRDALEQLAGNANAAGAAEAGMHAAHSLKGAARIVGLDLVERVSGAMEACLEAAIERQLPIRGALSEKLASAAGWLARFEQLTEEEAARLPGKAEAEAESLVGDLDKLRAESPAASSGELADLSLLDLFQQEAEAQSAQLNRALLELEGDLTNPEKIEPVMRTAHSLKGAARIVGLGTISALAHLLEDVLVAAQKGQLTLSEDHMDVIFRAADIFARLASLPGEQIAGWPAEHAAVVDELTAVLRAIQKGEPAPASRVPFGPEKAPAPATTPASPERAEHAGVVRVSSENLNRLMGLSAESLVQTSRLQGLIQSVTEHKRAYLRLADLIDRMQNETARQSAGGGIAELLRDASDQTDAGLRSVVTCQEEFDSYARRTTLLSEKLYREVLASRMRPFGDVADGFRRQVRDMARALGKKATLVIKGRNTPVDRDVLDDLQAPLNHILRNAVDHGIEAPERRVSAGKPEAGTITLEVRHHAGMLLIEVGDDGRGIDLDDLRRRVLERGLANAEMAARLSETELLEFPFLPGFSTAASVTEVSGRGVGLDVVQTMVRNAGGSVRLSAVAGQGTTVHLNLPITRSVVRTLVAEVDGEPYAFPLTGVRHCLEVNAGDLNSAEGRQYLTYEGGNIGLVSAREALELGAGSDAAGQVSVVVLGDKEELYGLEVDRFIGQHDLVIRPLDARLGKVANITAAALLDDGSPVLIIDVKDLIRSIDNLLAGGRIGRAHRRAGKAANLRRKAVLVVDDSITVRETERKLLENEGYAVDVAVDGADGWNAVRLGTYDLVISDVDMPRMTGIEFVRKIKQDPRLKPIPVMIVSYKDRQEDRMAGLDAGANYYLTKSSFKDEALIDAVRDLIGGPEE